MAFSHFKPDFRSILLTWMDIFIRIFMSYIFTFTRKNIHFFGFSVIQKISKYFTRHWIVFSRDAKVPHIPLLNLYPDWWTGNKNWHRELWWYLVLYWKLDIGPSDKHGNSPKLHQPLRQSPNIIPSQSVSDYFKWNISDFDYSTGYYN